MSQLPPEIDEADLHLQRLVRLDMMAVEHAHAALLDATEPGEIAEMARAYTRITRSARQHLALHHRMKLDRARAQREADRHQAWLDGQRRQGPDADERKTVEEIACDERADDLSHAVGRVISRAAAGDRARHTALVHRFDRELDDWYEADDFLDVDLDVQVARACELLGLPAELAAGWRDLPPPVFFPEPEIRAGDAAARDDAAGPPPPWTETG
jgi:hypothetical protein